MQDGREYGVRGKGGRVTCRSCAERRRRLLLERQRKKEEGRKVQAAALGAVLVVTEVAGKALGIKGEDDDGQVSEDPGSSERARRSSE